MIYRNSFLKKELRQDTENRIGIKWKTSFALFMGLLSFALYFVFQTLQESILADVVPEIMQPSYFSTVYIYIHLAFGLYTGYYILHYDTLFFSEIRKNSWYLLIQMGYHPAAMFYAKFFALLHSAFLVYSLGFIITLLLTTLLKFPLIIAYLPSLYLVGFMDLALITILAMVFSLYARTVTNARYGIAFSSLLILALKALLGHYEVIGNRVAMQNILNLLDTSSSLYTPFWIGLVMVCALICLLRSRSLARYYNVTEDVDLLPENVSLVLLKAKAGKKKFVALDKKRVVQPRIFDWVITTFLLIFLTVALILNLFIIAINATTSGQIVSFRGVIPFIFQSRTMEPAIMVNDLTYFQKVHSQSPIKTGQIILFDENNMIYIERVVEIREGQFIVDIDNYPPLSQMGAMKKSVPREKVQGVYLGRNRWLGALILFANTFIGRVFFLLIPGVLLFYQRRIFKFPKK